ncbi:PREDICTED: DNA (cytosine-5)-methyltransferase CMT2 isoform X2 [Tarenaya hassleriana]|uniref:DNA (cytosine-5)-methyltransferase CMT2 isoform X2 n=1 Tax=Tarenaya hassleriana TaxID=28532 RepID=UPI00053C3C2A|nr:PREDICTED: DNA (cytosine-5)-methyltransferase CMT2 isoform X2 [Tarenaya hassleriana]
MLSPAGCQPMAGANSESGSVPSSEPERLSLQLWLPDSSVCVGGEVHPLPLEVREPNRRRRMKLTSSLELSGERCLRRSPRFSCKSPAEAGVSPANPGGGKRLLMLTDGVSVRRSPRLASIRGKIDNGGTPPVVGRVGSKMTEGNANNSAPAKRDSSDSRGMTFKDIAALAIGLEDSILESGVECKNVEGGSRLRYSSKPLLLKWKDDNDSVNKPLRRSPRFTKVMGNGEREEHVATSKEKRKTMSEMENGKREEHVGTSKTQMKTISSDKPCRRSPRLSGNVENGCAETLNIMNNHGSKLRVKLIRGAEKTEKISRKNGFDEDMLNYEDVAFVSSKQNVTVSDLSYTKLIGDAGTVGNSTFSELNTAETRLATFKTDENGYKKTFLNCDLNLPVEQEMEGCSLLDKTLDHCSSDKELQEESRTRFTVVEPSNCDEQPAKKVKISSENSHVNISDGDISKQAASAATNCTEANGDHIFLNLNQPPKLTQVNPKKATWVAVLEQEGKLEHSTWFFIGEPIPFEEALERWRWRYDLKKSKSRSRGQQLNDDDEDEIVASVECHYSQANVNGRTFSLGDFAYIRGEEQKHVGKIIEFFKTTDGEGYFRVQWFYRAEDTVMKQQAAAHDERRLFYSTVMNDNPIDCIISNVSISQVSPRAGRNPSSIQSDFYFDMEYCVEYSTFRTLRNNNSSENDNMLLLPHIKAAPKTSTDGLLVNEHQSRELTLLDLYSGCGGMSTGLCLGAKISGVGVITKWAVDLELSACQSLKLNHPETQVRNDAAGDFLQLLKEWDKLCKLYAFDNEQRAHKSRSMVSEVETSESSSSSDYDSESDEFEVEKLVDICYGDPGKTGKAGLKFKVHWRGYSCSEDSWEPAENLSTCQDSIREFVRNGLKSKILPRPGDVDVICGGPPCQGISGYNRFRNVDSPLNDEKNQQIIVFMDIVEFLKPKFVLMENVVDILRLDKASLGRYALSRLVNTRYQARLGIMAAGCYGLAQFRLRVFLWGAHPNEILPQFPLPSHDVIVRYWSPPEFERNVVAYDEGQPRELEKALVLQDAISDLPPVSNDESCEKISYGSLPETDFQRYIRSTKHEMTGSEADGCTKRTMMLHDHRPYNLNKDDWTRVCQIPKRKGANFRDLPGIIIRQDGTVRRDPSMMPVVLPSGKPLIPDYVFTFEQGKSKRPFARLWWDETVPTVLTFPSCRNQFLSAGIIASGARSDVNHTGICEASRFP